MPAIEYADYKAERMSSRIQRVEEQSGLSVSVTYVGLAPSNVPESMGLSSRPNGELLIEARYAEMEKAEDREHFLPTSRVHLTLGRNSKKILRIRAENARDFLVACRGRLNARDVTTIAAQFPPRLGIILEQSASLISEIMETMPQQHRTLLLGKGKKD